MPIIFCRLLDIGVAEIMETYFGKPHFRYDGLEMVVDRHAGQMSDG